MSNAASPVTFVCFIYGKHAVSSPDCRTLFKDVDSDDTSHWPTLMQRLAVRVLDLFPDCPLSMTFESLAQPGTEQSVVFEIDNTSNVPWESFKESRSGGSLQAPMRKGLSYPAHGGINVRVCTLPFRTAFTYESVTRTVPWTFYPSFVKPWLAQWTALSEAVCESYNLPRGTAIVMSYMDTLWEEITIHAGEGGNLMDFLRILKNVSSIRVKVRPSGGAMGDALSQSSYRNATQTGAAIAQLSRLQSEWVKHSADRDATISGLIANIHILMRSNAELLAANRQVHSEFMQARHAHATITRDYANVAVGTHSSPYGHVGAELDDDELDDIEQLEEIEEELVDKIDS